MNNDQEYEQNLKTFAESNGFIGYFSVSSKTGKNVSESMDFILKIVIKIIKEIPFEYSSISSQVDILLNIARDLNS